jgi:UDP-N-acetylmuramoylalanine--D-glutamate ligase
MVKNWQGKKIVIMGLGLQGGALHVAKWLLQRKAQLTITDLKSAEQLKTSIDELKKITAFKSVKFTLGQHLESDFVDQDLIIQNPGVPRESKFLKIAKKNKIPIINEAVLFFGLFPGKIIGVTGTRGKSTTSTLLHHILKTEIKNNVIAGNIATTPMLSVVDKLSKTSWPVLELSSWHLESLADYQKSPQIAIVTNVLIDHLNRYKNFNAYKKAKSALVRYQKAQDFAILNYDNVHSKSFAKLTKAKVYYFSLQNKVKGVFLENDAFYFNNGKKIEFITKIEDWKIFGQHNFSNAAAAITAAKLLGIQNKNISRALKNFKGVEFRFQALGKLKQVEVFNDATASTPDATMAALRALGNKKIILIAGGEDKQLDYLPLAKLISSQKNISLLLLSGGGSQKLLTALKASKYHVAENAKNIPSLELAYQKAKSLLPEADVLLFSPAASSFNMFANEFERARLFEKLVKNDQV